MKNHLNVGKAIFVLGLSVPFLFACGGGGEASSAKPKYQTVTVDDMTLNYYEEYEGYAVEDYKGGKSEISIPSTVTVDGRTFPVTRVSDNAFYSRSSIKQMQLPDSVYSIGEHAFEGTSLEKIYVTGALREIGATAFDNTPFEALSDDGLLYLPSLTNEYAVLFGGTTRSWSYSLPDGIESIICNALEGLDLGAVNLSNAVTIGDGAFKGATFDSITFGEKLQYIGKEAFSGCEGLTRAVFSDGLLEVGDNAFEDCVNITTLSLPKTVKKLGKSIIYSQTASLPNLSSLTLPFLGYDENTPERAEVILGNLLNNDGNPINVTIDHGILGSGAFASGANQAKDKNGSWYITSYSRTPAYYLSSLTLNNVKEIRNHACYGNSTLTDVKLGDSLTSVGSDAFSYCGYTSIYIPKTVTKIERDAFYSQVACLISVGADNGDAYEGDWYNRFGQTTVVYGVVDGGGKSQSSDFEYLNAAGTATITGYKGKDTEVVIPEKINNLPVTTIASYAFGNHPNIKKLTVPTTDIADNAFAGLTGLQELIINNKVEYMDGVANGYKWFASSSFTGSYAITKSLFPARPGSDTIYRKAYIPSSLKKLTITSFDQNGRLYIGMACFADFQLTSITLNAKNFYMDEFAFYNCSKWQGTIYLGEGDDICGAALTGTSQLTIYVASEQLAERWGTSSGQSSKAPWTDAGHYQIGTK